MGIMKLQIAGLLVAVSCYAAEPQPLFNGKNLENWRMTGPGRFVVENGLLKTEGGMGLLWFEGRKIGNETLRVVFRTSGDRDNSGVVIRLPEPPTDPWYGVHNGYEVQIDAAGDEWHRTGAIYSLSKATKQAQKPVGEWNTLEIRMDGQVTRVTLNGELVNYFDASAPVPERKQWFEPVRGPRPDYGFVGLQNHDPRSTVYFREISVIPTEKSPVPMAQGERDRMLSYYHATRKQLLDAVAGLTPEQWNYRPDAGKWSIAEVVEHLALTEDFLFGFGTSYLKNPKMIAPSKEAVESLVSNMTDRSTPAQAPGEVRPTGRLGAGPETAQAFRDRRDKYIGWIGTTKEPLTRVAANWFGKTISVYEMLHLIPAHTERHLKQINEVKASSGYPRK